jgi:polyhydroxyalkanoate synthesis regulator phasin
MVDKAPGSEIKPAEAPPATAAPTGTATVPPPRRPGHRGADVRDTVAEMAARAQEISLEAGSKIAAAMKDVIGAAAGLTGFALESARDLVQYMVRRGQMTQDEADKLIREVEDSQGPRRASVPARPTQPRPAEVVRTEAPRQEPARPDPARADPARADSDGKKHAAPVVATAPKPVAKAARPAKAAARPAKKAAPPRSAARSKPAAAKKGAAKAKKKR